MGKNEDSGAGKVKPSWLTTSDNAETLLLGKSRVRCPLAQWGVYLQKETAWDGHTSPR